MTQKHDSRSIYSILLHEIQFGRIAESAVLREIDIAERFSVSRTPAREALNNLVHDGLLLRTPKGLMIRTVTPDEVIKTYTVRIMLEGEAAAEAAENRNETDLARLEGLLRRDRETENPSDETRAKLNIEFHQSVWAAAHNQVLTDLLERLTVHLIHKPQSTLSVGNRWSEALDQHEELITAIQNRDAGTARKLAENHMRQARDLRLELFRHHIATPS